MWTFNGKPFSQEDVEPWMSGFVYQITNNISKKKYIGKKIFQFTNRVKKKGRKNRVVVKKPSDWVKYWGSSDILLEDVKKLGEGNFSKEILSIHESRQDMNYWEAKYQMLFNVLESDDYYNSNILTKFFRKKETKSLFASEDKITH